MERIYKLKKLQKKSSNFHQLRINFFSNLKLNLKQSLKQKQNQTSPSGREQHCNDNYSLIM